MEAERFDFSFGKVPEAKVGVRHTSQVDPKDRVPTLMEVDSKETRDAIIATGMEAGMQDAMDLLEEVAISLK